MRFSIITVTYNNLEGLQKTFESIRHQKFKEFEWIVVDGLSTDGTQAYLKEISSTFNCSFSWISERDKGIYDAMNKGIKASSGEYLIFLNGGDVFTNASVLINVNNKILNHPSEDDSVIYYGGFRYSYGTNKKTMLIEPRNISYLKHGLPSSHQSFFYPRKFVHECLYDLDYKISSDYYITCMGYKMGYSFEKIRLSISDFEVGGTSGQHYFQAIREAFIIQRDILNVNLLFRIGSALKRGMSYGTMRLLNKIS